MKTPGINQGSSCAVITAHPDDETLWAGGLMLLHPDVKWTVLSLTHASDIDRAPKFYKAMKQYGANGIMADLDDSPQQAPLKTFDIEKAIMDSLPSAAFDCIITHSMWGEYTRHLRHEEVAKAVGLLRQSREISSDELWQFAYEDNNGKHLPHPVADADITCNLPDDIWQKKYEIITNIYEYPPDSFQAKTTPKKEAFWLLGK